MLHRNYVFALLLSFTLVNLNGQSIQVVMSPNPSPYISDWQDKTETATLIISNISGRDISVKIKTELYDSKGTLVANTDASKMPILIVPPGVNQYHAEDIFPSNAVSYKGSLQISTVKTGRIPDDSYKFCVTLTDPQNGNPMGTSGTVCKLFNILDIQAPVLINPRDEESIPESGIKGIVFRWSPVTPAPKMIVTYRLQIWEVLEGQNGMTALRSNQPIVEKDYRGLLQTQWPVEFAMPEVGKKYVWTVTPLDDQERKLVDGNGFAQPFGFSIQAGSAVLTSQEIVLLSPADNAEIDPLKAVLFSWKGGSNLQNNSATYRLKVWQLMQGQNPSQAMRENEPIFTRDMENVTQIEAQNIYTGPCRPPYLCAYVWLVELSNSQSAGENIKSKASGFRFMEEKSASLILKTPADNSELENGKSITFSWSHTPVQGASPGSYRIKVWQLMQGQNGSQAMASNPPILEKDVKDILIDVKDQSMKAVLDLETGPCRPPYLCNFVWTVEPLVAGGSNEGKRSQAYNFKIKSPQESSLRNLTPSGLIEAGPFEELNFSWTPLEVNAVEPVTYRLKIWQLKGDLSPADVMRSNNPIVTKEVSNITQTTVSNVYTGPCRPPYLCNFVWNVQAMTRSGGVVNSKTSEFTEFKIKKPKYTISLQLPENNSKIDPQNDIIFKWTAPATTTKQEVRYRLKVWPLLNGQDADMAMRNNQPSFHRMVENLNEITVSGLYTGPCRPPYLCIEMWKIEAFVLNGQGTEELIGESEASKFYISQGKWSSVKLSSPKNLEEVDLGKAVVFRWTSPEPKDPGAVTYRLRIWQLMDGMGKTETMRKSQASITKEVNNLTEVTVSDLYTGPCRPPYLCDFIWNVQASNSAGIGIGDNNGVSETFEIIGLNTRSSALSPTSPEDGAELDTLQPIVFKWAAPKTSDKVTYRLKVWQLMQGQNASQAMRSNQPIVTREVDNLNELTLTNLYTGPCRPPYLCDFVWSVSVAPQGENADAIKSKSSVFHYSPLKKK